MGTRSESNLFPNMATSLLRRFEEGKSNSSEPLLKNKNLISGCASATLWNSSMTCLNSTVSDFKKFLRAGML